MAAAAPAAAPAAAGPFGPNIAPIAIPDFYTIAEDSGLTVAGRGVLGNDFDLEGSPLTATLVAGPKNGTVTFNPNGTFAYTPKANYSGVDTFTYRVSDGAASAVGTVLVTVNAVNDLPVAAADTYTTAKNAKLTVAAAAGVLKNDVDPDGPLKQAQLVSGPANGTLALNANGAFTYTPQANFQGTVTFTYRVSDGVATSAPTTVSITVGNPNTPPVANADSGAVNEGSSVAINVLGNDTDAQGNNTIDPASVEVMSGPASGSTSVNTTTGAITYTSNGAEVLSDSFTYRVKDASGATSNIATVSIGITPVNDAPTAVGPDGPFATNEDAAVTLSAGQLVGNDTDPEAGALSVDSAGGAVNGSVVLNGDGSVTFTPTVNASGPASFTYKVKDAAGAVSLNSATVDITVNPVNDAPTAVGGDGPFVTNEDTAITIGAAALVGNDTDVEAGALSVDSVGDAVNGAVVLNGDGSVTFTPTVNASGPASFTYKVKDPAGAVSLNSATVDITVNPVNDAPTAVGGDGPFVTNEDVAVTLTAAQLVGNDTDVEAGVLAVDSVGDAINGAVVLNGDGTVTFTPTANASGPASFTYTVKDAAGRPVPTVRR